MSATGTLSEIVSGVEEKKADQIAMAYTHMSVRLPDLDRLLDAAKALETARDILDQYRRCNCSTCVQINRALAVIDKACGDSSPRQDLKQGRDLPRERIDSIEKDLSER